MITAITGYYTDEIADWSSSINFYDAEISGLEKKLGEVIRQDGIVDLAGKVEAQQKLLDIAADKFYKLQTEFEQQESALKTDEIFTDDSQFAVETEIKQDKLRVKMREAVKEYIDVKFDCYNFLSEVMKKRKKN
jgi:hypothetical protein